MSEREGILVELRDRADRALKLAPGVEGGYRIRLGTEIADDEKGVVVGIMPGDDIALDDEQVSLTVRLWEVGIGISVAAATVESDVAQWLRLERLWARLKREVERDRRLGGRLAFDIERGDVGAVPRSAGGRAVGIGASYVLRYAERPPEGDPGLYPEA